MPVSTWITAMSRDSDLYGEDIHLWSERQAALLRRLAAGEAVTDQVDWPHVVEEIEDLGHGLGQCPYDQDEIARLTALLEAAEARVIELRAKLDDLTGRLSGTQAELASAQGQAEAATARAVAAVEAEQAIRQSETERLAKGLWARLKAAWRGE
jgi:chromosome segregation ATPase